MSVGQSLAAARAERGLTLEALSAATRIRASMLRAIESDDFSMCGGDVYARGHIRSIARVIETDPEPLLAQFDLVHPRETIEHTVESIGKDWKPVTRERKGIGWGTAMLAAILVAVCGIVIYGFVKPPQTPTVASGPTTSAPTPTPTVAPVTTPAPSTSVTPVAPATTTQAAPTDTVTDIAKARRDGVNLRLRVTGAQCWVSVTSSSGSQVAVTLHKGDVRDFHDATELRLVIGDAGALTIIDNGTELPPLGGPGAVVRRTFRATAPTAGSG